MLTREEALAIYHAGPETVVRVLLEMDARIHALEQQVSALTVRLDTSEQRVKHLEKQLAKNSRNSQGCGKIVSNIMIIIHKTIFSRPGR